MIWVVQIPGIVGWCWIIGQLIQRSHLVHHLLMEVIDDQINITLTAYNSGWPLTACCRTNTWSKAHINIVGPGFRHVYTACRIWTSCCGSNTKGSGHVIIIGCWAINDIIDFEVKGLGTNDCAQIDHVAWTRIQSVRTRLYEGFFRDNNGWIWLKKRLKLRIKIKRKVKIKQCLTFRYVDVSSL